jgi:hypothetical protein
VGALAPSGTEGRPADRLRAWLVTGPLGRGAAFALDFAAALRRGLRRGRRGA